MSIEQKLRTEPLSDDMRILYEQYPREIWDGHENFKEETRHWLGAHRMFRRLAALLREDAETLIDRKIDPDKYSSRLSYYGNQLVGFLHGHHSWEDFEYFPELSRADSRFDRGLEILENDHKVLDEVLHDFTEQAIKIINLIEFDEEDARNKVGQIHGTSQTVERLLKRHLADEEDLAVPIILHHKLRG